MSSMFIAVRKLDRRWISVGLVALVLALAYGIWYAYGVILVALIDEFDWTRSTLAGAFSLFAVVHGLANPAIGFLCDRVQPSVLIGIGGAALSAALWANSLINAPWHLYLVFGFFTALAVAVCGWAPAVVQVQRLFHRRVGLALGIVSSGVGVGMLVVVPLCQVLIESFGWRMAFRALAVITAAIVIPIAVYLYRHFRLELGHSAVTKNTATAGDGQDATAQTTLPQAVRCVPFWLIVATFFFGSTSSQTMHVHQVVYLVEHGIETLVAASVVGVIGVASIFGKTGGGWLSDRMPREEIYIAGVLILVLSIGVIMVAGETSSSAIAYVYAVLLGVGYSATAALVPLMMSDRFRGPAFGSILGIGLLGSAAGSALGPWMGGYLFDRTGGYELPFALAAASGVMAALTTVFARRFRRAER